MFSVFSDALKMKIFNDGQKVNSTISTFLSVVRSYDGAMFHKLRPQTYQKKEFGSIFLHMLHFNKCFGLKIFGGAFF